ERERPDAQRTAAVPRGAPGRDGEGSGDDRRRGGQDEHYFLRARRRTLPAALRGMSRTTSMSRGSLYGARLRFENSRSSSGETVSPGGSATTYACTRSPVCSSGSPTTATSPTWGCRR